MSNKKKYVGGCSLQILNRTRRVPEMERELLTLSEHHPCL